MKDRHQDGRIPNRRVFLRSGIIFSGAALAGAALVRGAEKEKQSEEKEIEVGPPEDLMSQLRSRASALSCGIGDPGATRSSRSEEAVGPLARMQAADQATGIRPLAAGQHTPTSSESTTSSSTWLLRYLGSRCAETTQPGCARTGKPSNHHGDGYAIATRGGPPASGTGRALAV